MTKSIDQLVLEIPVEEREKVYSFWANPKNLVQDEDEIKYIIGNIWQANGYKPPTVLREKSPLACVSNHNLDNSSKYFSFWTLAYAMFYDLCKKFDIEIKDMPQKDIDDFLIFAKNINFVHFNTDVCVVSDHPLEIHHNERMQLHNENGASILYPDGAGMYHINGVVLNKKIVMTPKEQTIQEILSDDNEERKRIRIERYGIVDFLSAINANITDSNRNYIEGTQEHILTGDKQKYLLCVCPSTGKEFYLEVPPTVESTKDAQMFVSCGLAKRIISAS